MSILITTNEPKRVRELFQDRVEVPMNFDMVLYTEAGKIGIERKQCPGDLLSSVSDGRLNREILAMREECDISVILLQGNIRYNKNGTVRLGKRTSYHWTDKGIKNLFRTIQYVEGCYLESARNSAELVQVVNDLQEYFDKPTHNSLHIRRGIRSDWIKSTQQEKIIYWIQGLPGVGIFTAKKIYEKFPAPLLLFQATPDDIDDIPRVGRAMATSIYEFLHGVDK